MIYVIRDTNLKDDDTNCFLTQYNVTTSKYSDTEYCRAIVFGNLDNARRFLYLKDAVELVKEMQKDPDHYWGGLCVMEFPNAETYVRNIKESVNTPDLPLKDTPEEKDDKEIYVIKSFAMGLRTDCFLTDVSIEDQDDGCKWRLAYDGLERAMQYNTIEEAMLAAERIDEVAPEDHVEVVTLGQAEQSVERLWSTTHSTEDSTSVPLGTATLEEAEDGIKATCECDTKKLIFGAKESIHEDVVNHPAHYENDNYQCIDVMEDIYGTEAVMNFCMCNAFKYIWRFQKKNGIEDIRKAQWYMNKYQELAEKTEDKE